MITGGLQQEMNLETPSQRGPDAIVVQQLRAALADGGWHTAKDLNKFYGLDDRELRVVVEFHGEEFVTGNRGYRLMVAATIDEIRQSAGRLRAQATKMIARAITLENAAHRRIHKAGSHEARNAAVENLGSGTAESSQGARTDLGHSDNGR